MARQHGREIESPVNQLLAHTLIPITGNLDLNDAEQKLDQLKAGTLLPGLAVDPRVVGIIPVHVGGFMMDLEAVDLQEAAAHAQASMPAGATKQLKEA